MQPARALIRALYAWATMPLCHIKAGKVERHVRPFLEAPVLDLGAGRCLIAREIQERNQVEVVCADVVDCNRTSMPLVLYDGTTLPFADGQFGTVLLAYVLHHSEDPDRVLAEAARVCRGPVVVFEDTHMGFWEKLLDTVINWLNHEDINTPHNFRTAEGWRETFRRLGLHLEYEEEGVEKEWFYPFVRHTMFVVRRGDPGRN